MRYLEFRIINCADLRFDQQVLRHNEADQVKLYFTRKTRKTVIDRSKKRRAVRLRGKDLGVSSQCIALAEAGSPDGKHY